MRGSARQRQQHRNGSGLASVRGKHVFWYDSYAGLNMKQEDPKRSPVLELEAERDAVFNAFFEAMAPFVEPPTAVRAGTS